MAKEKHIKHLLDKYLHNSLSPEEYRELLQYFNNKDREHASKQLLYDTFKTDEIEQPATEIQMRKVMDGAYKRMEQRMNKTKFSQFRRILPYAAAILAITFVSIYFFEQQHIVQKTQLVSVYGDDALPGFNTATLTLENGKSFALSANKNGIKVNAGQILYNDGTKVTEKQLVQYATLSTPRKGQYQLLLPDGTKVWLNAESSLRYPTSFKGTERKVELTGEGYFEVAHDAHHPFIVQSKIQRIKVLGTTFNINTYANEKYIVTTLLSGRIELENLSKGTRKILDPEQQSVLKDDVFYTSRVDVQSFVGWKDGKFRFKGASMHEALRQLERWYDIDVDYQNVPEGVKIYASIKRDKKLSSVLGALGAISGVKFKIEGRRLIVMD